MLSSNGYAIISHDGLVQDLIEKSGISWGAQYELARGVSKGWWEWSAVTREKLKLLLDSKDAKVPAASKVVDIMVGRDVVSRRLDLWYARRSSSEILLAYSVSFQARA